MWRALPVVPASTANRDPARFTIVRSVSGIPLPHATSASHVMVGPVICLCTVIQHVTAVVLTMWRNLVLFVETLQTNVAASAR